MMLLSRNSGRVMQIFLGWLALSIVAGIVASARGRNGLGYFVLSMVVTPLVGLLLVALLPSRAVANREDAAQRMPCPNCAELVLVAANTCKHCGADLAAARAALAAQAQAARDRDAALRARPGYSISQDLANVISRVRGKRKG